MKLSLNVCLSEKSHGGPKNRSAGQVLENLCACHRSHIFSPVLLKDGQDVCLDDILDKLENGSKTRSTSQNQEQEGLKHWYRSTGLIFL